MSIVNFNNTTPAAPGGNTNVTWQQSGDSVSAYVPNSTSPLTTKGDLYGYDTGPDRIPVGTNGTLLQADSTQSLGLKWASQVSSWGITIDGGGSVPATGSKGYIQIPYACTITGWTILADQSGSCQVTIKKCAYSGFPTTSSIVASAPPAVTSAQNNTSTTLTGWTTAVSATDVIEFNLDSVTTMTRIMLSVQVTRP
jgi:hypothetical protein